MTRKQAMEIIKSMPPKNFLRLLDKDPSELSDSGERISLSYDDILMYKLMGWTNVSIAKAMRVSPSTIDRRVNKLKEEGYM